MKTKFIKKCEVRILVGIIIALLSFSCDDKISLIDDDIELEEIPITRALSYDVPSTSNPTLHSDWENVQTIYLNKGGYTDAPWIIKQGSPNDIPRSYAEDIKKSEGWTMLSHTIITTGSADPDYMIFYNSKRGLLKVFYHNPERVANASLLWTVEANTATSILPSNEIAQGTFNSTNKYATTSNVINESAANFGQLSYGWNMFTMELPYGETNSNPIIAIRAYNSITSKIELGGNFTGEVTINFPKESNSKISSITSALNKIPGVKDIPGFSTVSSAVSFLGQLGGSSLFTTKEGETTAVKGTTAGTIQLTGNSFAQFGGGVASLVNIDIKKINNGVPLGLWTLKETPSYRYEEYNLGWPIYVNSYSSDYNANVSLFFDTKNYSKLEDMVIINPAVKSSISTFRVKNIALFTSQDPGLYRYSQIYPTIYNLVSTQSMLPQIIAKGQIDYPASSDLIVVVQRQFYRQMYGSITIEFTYTDGSKFESTKNFKLNTTPVRTNLNYIESVIQNYRQVVYAY